MNQDGAAKGMAMAEEGLWISDLRLIQTSPIPEQCIRKHIRKTLTCSDDSEAINKCLLNTFYVLVLQG